MPDTDNLTLWNRLGKTDPAHTKAFTRGGGFKGTAIKPIYTTQKMTEEFGPAGKGWGMGEPMFQVVPGSEGQVAVYCTVSLWWHSTGGEVYTVYGVGGDMVVVKQSSGLRTDDEAFKKAFTDAIGNAMKHLGMSADVHMGLFDDSKYVTEAKREFAADHAPAPAASPQGGALPKAKARDGYTALQEEIDACLDIPSLGTLWTSPAFKAELATMPDDWKLQLTERKDQRKAELSVPDGRKTVAPNFDRIGA